MIHAVFYRPGGVLSVFNPDGLKVFQFAAGGDAWGRVENPDGGPYGYEWPCPPGHYLLGDIDQMSPPLVSEGAYQIHVDDIDNATMLQLIAAKRATNNGDLVTVGGVTLPVKQLAKYGRSAIMIHGGGSNAPIPLAESQELCRTMGCTRLHNADLEKFVVWLREYRHGNTAVYSILGDPNLLAN